MIYHTLTWTHTAYEIVLWRVKFGCTCTRGKAAGRPGFSGAVS